MEPASQRPGPGARVVSRPSLLAVIIWPYITLIAVALVVFAGTAGKVFGGLLLLLCVFAVARLIAARTWVEGAVLYSRGVARAGEPIRLDRLTSAHLTPFGRNQGRALLLTDADGHHVRLDATNHSLRRLWPILAEHVRWDTGVANDILRKRLAKHWPPPPLGPGD
jgi:hypothetical protein